MKCVTSYPDFIVNIVSSEMCNSVQLRSEGATKLRFKTSAYTNKHNAEPQRYCYILKLGASKFKAENIKPASFGAFCGILQLREPASPGSKSRLEGGAVLLPDIPLMITYHSEVHFPRPPSRTFFHAGLSRETLVQLRKPSRHIDDPAAPGCRRSPHGCVVAQKTRPLACLPTPESLETPESQLPKAENKFRREKVPAAAP